MASAKCEGFLRIYFPSKYFLSEWELMDSLTHFSLVALVTMFLSKKVIIKD